MTAPSPHPPALSATTAPRRTIRAALYCRASTAKKAQTIEGEEYRQRPEIQEQRLRALSGQRGWDVVAVYTDRASGRKETRPELDRLMQDARRGQFDLVAVAAFDRFARSTKHLIIALDEFHHLNIQFVSLREGATRDTLSLQQIIQSRSGQFESFAPI